MDAEFGVDAAAHGQLLAKGSGLGGSQQPALLGACEKLNIKRVGVAHALLEPHDTDLVELARLAGAEVILAADRVKAFAGRVEHAACA